MLKLSLISVSLGDARGDLSVFALPRVGTGEKTLFTVGMVAELLLKKYPHVLLVFASGVVPESLNYIQMSP